MCVLVLLLVTKSKLNESRVEKIMLWQIFISAYRIGQKLDFCEWIITSYVVTIHLQPFDYQSSWCAWSSDGHIFLVFVFFYCSIFFLPKSHFTFNRILYYAYCLSFVLSFFLSHVRFAYCLLYYIKLSVHFYVMFCFASIILKL